MTSIMDEEVKTPDTKSYLDNNLNNNFNNVLNNVLNNNLNNPQQL